LYKTENATLDKLGLPKAYETHGYRLPDINNKTAIALEA